MLTITHYIQFLNDDGSEPDPPDGFARQNYFIGETRVWEGLNYAFAPFSLAGNTASSGSFNPSATLIAPDNLISGAVLWQAAIDRRLVKVNYVALIGVPPDDPDGVPVWEEQYTLLTELWVCDSFGYSDAGVLDDDSPALINLRLTTPFNAVTGRAPTLRLNDEQVGALPSTGSVFF